MNLWLRKNNPTYRCLFFVVIFLWVILVYSNSLYNSFQYDDIHHIRENFNIRKLTNIPSFFKDPRMFSFHSEDSMYRPFLLVTYALNYYIHGNNVVGFHIVNVLLHAINAILVFLILLIFFSTYHFIPFLIALLYATHPVNTEAVNYISSRSDVLSTTFFLSSFYLFIRGKPLTSNLSKGVDSGKKYNNKVISIFYLVCYFISLIFYFLGLLTKEVVITLPIILFLYDWFFISRDRRSVDMSWKKEESIRLSDYTSLIGLHLPFWITTAIYLYIRRLVMGASGVMSALHRTKPISLSDYTVSYTTLYQITQIKVILQYLKLWFVPTGLTVEHGYPLIESFKDIWLWFSLVILTVLLGVSIILYKRDNRITFFSLWFVVALLPTTLLPLNVVMAEKRLYLPGIGLAGIVAVMLTWICSRKILKDGHGYRIVIALVTIIILLFSGSTFSRNRVWRDGITLWKDALEKTPHSFRAYGLLGEAYLEKGLFDKAIDSFKTSLSINPEQGEIYNDLGIILYRKGRVKESLKTFKDGIKFEPRMPELYNNLGNIYYKIGEYQKSVDMYKKAIQIRPEFGRAYGNLGSIYFILKDYERARYYYQKAVEIDPENIKAIENLRRLNLIERDTK